MAAAPEPFEELAQRIAPGSTVLRTWELKGGASAQVTAFELRREDGATERLIVRRHGTVDLRSNPRIATDEFRLLELLQSADVPAPPPRYVDEHGEVFGTPCLVVDYVEGEATAGEVDVGQLAAVLAKIHGIDASTADLSFLPEQTPIPPSRTPADDQPIRDVLERALPLPRANPPVLLHGDFWPGNTLWKDGRLTAVIDWEDAAVGDPLADVANARLELLWSHGREAMDEFTARYRALRPGLDFTDLPYWDLWADLRLAPRIGEWGLDETTVRRLREGHEAFLAQALERLPAR